MALANTAKLLASLDLDISRFTANSKKAMADLGKMETTVGRIGGLAQRGAANAARNIATIGAVAAGVGVTAITAAIKEASDLAETQSKVNVVFGKSAASVLAFGKTAASSLGLSENAAEGAAATYGNLFVSMGLAQDKSAEMSTSLVKLAGDLASFNNMDPTEVLEKLRAGLTGESEPLKTLGININEAIIKQKALDLGLIKTTTGTLPAAIKAQAAYALIFEQSTTAQGDFARTSEGLANQQRVLRANMANTAAVIGTKLTPKIAELVQKINTLVVNNQPAIAALADKLPVVFDKIVGIASNIPWQAVGESFKLMGQGAEAALNLFASAPPWLQTAVITGWGLNKLTGGALGSIVGELGKGLVKGVLGIQAGVVNVKGAVVNGGGPGAVGPAAGAGAAGRGASAVRILGTVALAAASIAGIAELLNLKGQQTAENKAGEQALIDQTKAFGQSASLPEMKASLAGIEKYTAELQAGLTPEAIAYQLNIDGVRDAIDKSKDELKAAIKATEAAIGRPAPMSPDERQALRDQKSAIERTNAQLERNRIVTASGLAATAAATNRSYDAIERLRAQRKQPITINFTANTRVTVRDSVYQSTQSSKLGFAAS